MHFTFHSLSLPHTVASADYNACAFTQKIVKFSRMMVPRSHTVYHYGHANSELPCTEHITVTDDATLETAYGGHDWRRHEFVHNMNDYAHKVFQERVIPALRARAKPGDFLLCWWGSGHKAVADAVADLHLIVVEPGIGWTAPSSSFAEWRVYESHAVRNAHEGQLVPQKWYSRVIPNYFDPADFEYRDSSAKEPWVLFLGRVGHSKGIMTCIQATAAAGVQLKIAGQGRLEDIDERVADYPHVVELGYADVAMRKDLLARASALIIATTYNEPFAGVQVEALLSGTPIITPFFGAFAEVNKHGVTGFHCHTLREFRDALLKRGSIKSDACRAHGETYCLEAVAPLYEQYFDDLSAIYDGRDGWNRLA
jgi:glycosyltransferase involved in cell wall biosynthesis